MGKYSDMVLGGALEDDEKKPSRKISDMVLGIPEVQREFTPTEEIDTRTGKPRLKYTPTGKSAPKFTTSIKAGFVDDPITKIKIYAKSRGLPVSRYRIVNGEIIYKDNDGKWYAEEKRLGAGKLKQIAGNIVPNIPSAILGGIGAAAGPWSPLLSPLGAAGGEGIRKTVGALAFGEPQTTTQNLKDMATVAAMDLMFERGGAAIRGGIGAGGRRLGGNVAKQAGSDIKYIDLKDAAKIKKLGEYVGVDLTVPQTTGSKKLADKFNLLGDIDASAPIIQAARKRQQNQIQDAVDEFFDFISKPPKGGKLESGKKLVDAAKKSIERPIAIRQAKAAPIYEKAFKTSGPVDVSEPLKSVDNLFKDLPEGKTAQRAVLKKVRRMFLKEEQVGGKTVFFQQDNLKVLDNAKKAIDKLLDGPEGAAIEADMKRRLSIIKDKLTSAMDNASPEYKKARNIFGEYSKEVERQGKKNIVADVSKLENDQVVTASRRLFSSISSSPETMARARKLIVRESPDAWNGALRNHLQDVFEKTKDSAGGVDISTNIGGMFFKRTLGDPAQRKILKAAMSPTQFDYFAKLGTVLERAGMILRKESATATRTEMMREIAGKKVTRVIEAQTRPMMTKWRIVGDWLNKYRLGNNSRELARAMTSETGHRQLNRVYQLSDGSERFIPALSVFLGMIGTDALKASHETYKE